MDFYTTNFVKNIKIYKMKKIVCLAGFLSFAIAFSQNHQWGYEGQESPEHWGETEEGKQCGLGQYQSPININVARTTVDKKLPKIIFNYGDGSVNSIVDNGHSLEFDFKQGSSITYNNKVYNLAQFHAHEESEHTVDGVRYPLELHFVHKAADGSALVIGVLVKQGEENSYFEKLKVFQTLSKNGKVNTDVNFNPEKMYPKDKSYYYYIGSLTTPPCAENVTWIVFKNPITMSEEEIAEIAKHLPKSNNRPVQPLHGRKITHN